MANIQMSYGSRKALSKVFSLLGWLKCWNIKIITPYITNIPTANYKLPQPTYPPKNIFIIWPPYKP